VETVPRQIEISGGSRLVQVQQHVTDPAALVGTEPAAIPLFKETLQATVPKALDQR
jgi:hypothetical protein